MDTQSDVWAQRAERFVAKTEEFLEKTGEPLPPASTLLPRSQGLDAAPAGILVANLVETTRFRLPWGKAIAELMRTALSDLPGITLAQPLLGTKPMDRECWHEAYDASLGPTRFEDLEVWSRSVRAGLGITGRVRGTGTAMVITLHLWNMKDAGEAGSRELRVDGPEELPQAIVDALRWALESCGQTLSDSAVAQLVSEMPASEMTAFARLFPLPAADEASGAEKKHARTLLGTGFIAGEIQARWIAGRGNIRPATVMADYATILETHRGHAELLSAQYWCDCDHPSEKVHEHVAAVALEALDDNPGQSALYSTALWALENLEDYRGRLRLSLLGLLAAPGQYASWATVADTLNDLAWDYRGEDWWDEVETVDQKRFVRLGDLAIKAMDIALGINGDRLDGLALRARLEHGCSARLIALYQAAIKLCPSYEAIYWDVMNFAQERWGGSLLLQMRIVKDALDNNPGKTWPYRLYSEYIGRGDGFTLADRISFAWYRFAKRGWPENFIARLEAEDAQWEAGEDWDDEDWDNEDWNNNDRDEVDYVRRPRVHENFPPASLVIPHDDFECRHVGTTVSNQRFFITTPFVPALHPVEGREFVACYLFDDKGQFEKALIEDVGDRASIAGTSALPGNRAPDNAVTAEIIDRFLQDIGPVEYRDIRVSPFQVERFGVTFGLIPEADDLDDGDDPYLAVIVQPGDYIAFIPPWDGQYDT